MTQERERRRIGSVGPTTNTKAWKRFEQDVRWHQLSVQYTEAWAAGKSAIPDVSGKKLPAVIAPKPKPSPEVAALKHPRDATGYPHIPNDRLAKEPGVADLLRMLTYMRPADDPFEEKYISRFLDSVEGMKQDHFGNRWLKIDGGSVIWSSHTDTVHIRGGIQTVCLGDGFAWAEDSSCLGADDTCGNWLMLEMIKARVPGLYIFHRQEECGGHGSTYLANKHGKALHEEGYKAIVAFDRKGYDSVITHQTGGRCCSDAFAKSLAKIMGGKFEPDPTGLFTDSANYTDYIGECTNLSVGYHSAHGPLECTNVAFLVHMRDRLIAADWSQLVIERQPGEEDPDDRYGSFFQNYNGYGYGGTRSNWKGKIKPDPKGKPYANDDYDTLEDYVLTYPATVAGFLLHHGYQISDIDDFWAEHDDVEAYTDASPWN
jgi:hypothetical protein